MISNQTPRRRWQLLPNTSSPMRKTLTSWMKKPTRSKKTKMRMRTTREIPLQNSDQEARALSCAERLLCQSHLRPPSTAAPSPLCQELMPHNPPSAAVPGRTIDGSCHSISPWTKTPWQCCLLTKPTPSSTLTRHVSCLLAGSLQSENPPRLAYVIHPRGESSPLEVVLTQDGTRLRYDPIRPVSNQFSTPPRSQWSDPLLREPS